MPGQWRAMYDQWERASAPMLEQIAGSDAVRDVIAVSLSASKAVMAETERLSRQWLHAWNLPAAGDVRQLRTEIARLSAEVARLAASASEAETTITRPTVVREPLWEADGAQERPAGESFSRAS